MGYTLRTALRQSRENSKAIKHHHSNPGSPSFLPLSPLAGPIPGHRLLLHGGAEGPRRPAGLMSRKALGIHPQLMVGRMAGSGRRLVRTGGAPGAPLSRRTPGFPQHLVVSTAIINLPDLLLAPSARLLYEGEPPKPGSIVGQDTQPRAKGASMGNSSCGRCRRVGGSCIGPVSSHALSTNSQPQGAGGFLPKTIYCISRRTQQRNQCPYRTHKPSSNTLLSQAHEGKGLGRGREKPPSSRRVRR